ncbi:MAG: hypothetical protein ABIQ72_18660 [Usitatibacter sp.]
MNARMILRVLVVALAVIPAMGGAQTMPAPAAEVPMLDPYVPPSARPKSLKVPVATEGTGLDAQVEAKLRARFEAASNGQGALTREQARAAGLGAIVQQFEAIDRAGRGAITFEDYRRHLQQLRTRNR